MYTALRYISVIDTAYFSTRRDYDLVRSDRGVVV
jgi:hypothetical protein